MDFSIVDSLCYSRGFPEMTIEHCLFIALCSVCTDEQFNRLVDMYTTRGDQTDNMIRFAEENGIEFNRAVLNG